MKQNRKKRAATRVKQLQAKLNSGKSREHVQTFIEKYILCEIASKEMLVGYKNDLNEVLEYKDAKMDLRQLKHAFNYYHLELPNDVIKRLFAADKVEGKRSAKKLRDSLLHGMTKKNITELDKQYNQLIDDIDAFLSAVIR